MAPMAGDYAPGDLVVLHLGAGGALLLGWVVRPTRPLRHGNVAVTWISEKYSARKPHDTAPAEMLKWWPAARHQERLVELAAQAKAATAPAPRTRCPECAAAAVVRFGPVAACRACGWRQLLQTSGRRDARREEPPPAPELLEDDFDSDESDLEADDDPASEALP